MLRTISICTFIAAAVAASGFARSASAGSITFTGNYANDNGTGNGPIAGVLSLQEINGNKENDYEFGYSGWSTTPGIGGLLTGSGGATPAAESWSSTDFQVHKDVGPKSGYFAQSVGVLAQAGINGTNLALTFQVNTEGSKDTMTIHTFDVVFIHADGSLVGTLTYVPDNHSLTGTFLGSDPGLTSKGVNQSTDNGVLPGLGQGTAGWLYTLNLSTILAADPNFFNNPNNRIGMNVVQFSSAGVLNFEPVNDGSDNFYFTQSNGPINPVPLPAAVWSGLAMLAGMGVLTGLRKLSRPV